MDTIISANEDILNLVKKIGKCNTPDECNQKIAELLDSQLLMKTEEQNAQKV